jgi:microcystin-dependent protein
MSDPFLGQITVFPYTFAPYGWMDCAGQILPIS